METEKLDFEIRLFELKTINKEYSKNPKITYKELLNIINKKVKKKFGKRQENLLKQIITNRINNYKFKDC